LPRIEPVCWTWVTEGEFGGLTGERLAVLDDEEVGAQGGDLVL
jgi:hypothetical protein